MLSRRVKGFALPSIMIASVVMLMVLAAAISSVATTRGALTDQYYNQIAKEAAESGVAMAEACIKGGTLTWPNPLRPGSDCNGAVSQCDTANCYLLNSERVRTTFSVDAPLNPGDTSTVRSIGRVELTRASNGAVWKEFTQGVGRISQGESKKAVWKPASLSASYYHSCAIASDSKAYCWGDGSNGKLGNGSTSSSSIPVAVDTSGVLSGKTIRSIALGSSHTCAIASDNLAYCWGYNFYGQLGNGATSQSSVPVAVTMSGSLAGKTIRDIAVGTNYTCVVASDNLAYCWGSGFSGPLGNGSTNNTTTPTAVTTSGVLSGKTIRSISAGADTTCVVASDNLAYCWGNNGSGQLGNNSTTQANSPVAVNTSGVLSGKTIKELSTAGYQTCAIASDNLAYCWGGNANGQLGNNSTTNSLVPVAVNTAGALSGKTIRAISSGPNWSHTCAIASDNNAYCWGANGSGQLGNNSTTNSLVPVAVNTSGALSGKTVRNISAGMSFTCASIYENSMHCWGSNSSGKLGDGTTDQRLLPSTVRSVATTAARPASTSLLAGGLSAMCSVSSDNDTYCWGNNNYGNFGNNNTTWGSVPTPSYTAPTSPMAGRGLIDISLGYTFSCAIATNHNAYCTGANGSGQLGNNSTTSSNIPVAVNTAGVLSGKTIRSLGLGMIHSCAVASDNLAYCWGENSSGSLGNNSTTSSSVPVAVNTAGVLSGKTIVQMSSGGVSNTCVIASDNNAYCWGSGQFGALGNGSTAQSNVPVTVTRTGVLSGKTIVQISSGDYHTCVIASDNNAYCWGRGSYGQLGNNSTADSSVPVAVNTSGALSGKSILAIGAGYYHTCALASDYNVYCWGWNTNGQLGIGSTTQYNVPVAVSTSGALSGKTVKAISRAGTHLTCVLASDDNTYCWGSIGGNVPSQMPYTDYPAIEKRSLYF